MSKLKNALVTSFMEKVKKNKKDDKKRKFASSAPTRMTPTRTLRNQARRRAGIAPEACSPQD